MVTVTALVVGGHTEQLPFHLKRAKENGVTEAELIEAITHPAFYGGWPRAMSAIAVVKEAFQPQKDRRNIYRGGATRPALSADGPSAGEWRECHL